MRRLYESFIVLALTSLLPSCGKLIKEDRDACPGILYFNLDEELDGPRCVRLGDLFSEDFCRFRSGENGMKDDLTEVLYGSEETVPRGTACYDPDNMNLSYVTETSAGLQVELLLKYENSVLTEIILQTL